MQQAELIGSLLSEQEINLIFASDVKRAKQTVEVILSRCPCQVIYKKELRERQETETYAEVAMRLNPLLDEIKEMTQESINLAIVSHGGINRTFLSLLFGGEAKEYKQDTACINIVNLSGHSADLLAFNSTEHLNTDR